MLYLVITIIFKNSVKITFATLLQYELPFVEVYRAREFTFRALPTLQFENGLNTVRSNSRLSVWNCDGEVIDNTNVKIR